MIRFTVFLLSLLLLPLLAWADAPGTARLIAKLYRAAGPRIGVTFVEPSVVLTLGGQKAHNDGWATLTDPQPSDEQTLLTLSDSLQSEGVRLQPLNMIESEQRFHLYVTSLPGLRHCLERSTLLGGVSLPTENTHSSWTHCTHQIQTILNDKFPGEAGQFASRLFLNGLTDEGLADDYQQRQIKSNDNRDILPEMGDYFDGPQPILHTSSRLSKDPQLLAQKQAWGEFLKQVYASPEFQAIASDPQFLAMRKHKIETHMAWLQKYRNPKQSLHTSPETIRLGLVPAS